MGTKNISRKKTQTRRRYSLVLPDELFEELQGVADARGTSVVELIRLFVKIGLMAIKLEDEPGDDNALIIRKGGKERELLIA